MYANVATDIVIDINGYYTPGSLGTNTNQAVAGNGATCTLGEIILSAGSVANGTPANGQILSIATATVTQHVENAKRKLDALRRTYAVVQAIRLGEISV